MYRTYMFVHCLLIHEKVSLRLPIALSCIWFTTSSICRLRSYAASGYGLASDLTGAWQFCCCSAPCTLEQEFAQGVGDNLPTLCEDDWGIVNGHQLMWADVTPSLTSIWRMAYTVKYHTACKTQWWHFIAGFTFKFNLDSLEVSVHTSWPSCQPTSSKMSLGFMPKWNK